MEIRNKLFYYTCPLRRIVAKDYFAFIDEQGSVFGWTPSTKVLSKVGVSEAETRQFITHGNWSEAVGVALPNK